MKKLLLSASVILLATGAFAQTTMTGSDARFGIKAGVNLARFHASGTNGNTSYNDNVKDNVGFNVTAFADFGVGNNFFIQPGVSLQNKGAKFESTNAVTAGNSTTTIVSTNKTSLMTIEVPINAVFRIPTGNAGAIQINAGPYVGFNISGKNKVESTTTISNNTANTSTASTASNENDLSFGSATDKNYSSTEFGANFGLAYRTNSGFLVGANYGLGLSNLIPKDSRSNGSDAKLTNRVLGLSVGYSF
ncbi:porin family protein [Pedobacter mucosus]|uniref:porin family protein n=1 Tax=Pedobacter mucosus TaxID=2895286 RepID=UPI001EE43405|nr:porin family protein [Pedobacter mucosus]UKT62820.1 PorT family protein [Pedobacter mucosus]